MVSIPTIQIQQQWARIGIDADLGQLEQHQPEATLDFRSTLPRVDAESPKGELRIDQSKAWDALGRGGTLTTLNRIYSEAWRMGQEGIARIVERGNRMAAIHRPGNVLADLAQEGFQAFYDFEFRGPAAFDNVELEYTAHPVKFAPVEGELQGSIQKNEPYIRYHRGKLDIYMQQYPRVDIIPPQIDINV